MTRAAGCAAALDACGLEQACCETCHSNAQEIDACENVVYHDGNVYETCCAVAVVCNGFVAEG